MQFHQFLRSENGAVSVDWVVLTASTVGLAVATLGVVSSGISSTSSSIQDSVSGGGIISTSFATAAPSGIVDFSNGVRGTFTSGGEEVGYTIVSSSAETTDDGAVIIANLGGNPGDDQSFAIQFDETNENGVRLEISEPTHRGGPTYLRLESGGNNIDLTSLIASGDASTNIDWGIGSGAYTGLIDTRNLPENAYVEIRTPMDDLVVSADAQFNVPDVEITVAVTGND